MLNLKELESQWFRYKLKSFIPHMIILTSLAIMIIIFISIDFEEKMKLIEVKKESPSIDTNISTYSEKNTIPLVIKKPIITQTIETNIQTIVDEEENKLLIKPSLDFIRNMKDNSPNYYNSYVAPKVSPTKKKKIVQEIATPRIEEIVLDTHVKEVEKQEIKIKRQNTQDDIQHVVKRFKESNNPALSLFIAKKYYGLKNYNQSYNYALLTNQINNDIEESWIIFAKSLYKLDQKDKAIEILNKYISSSHSHRAEMLLENIKSGKMK